MNVVFLTKYTRLGASSRMRSYQFAPYFSVNGIAATYRPLFDDDYLKKLYAGKPTFWTAFKAYFRRFSILFTLHRYDAVVIEKEIFPYLPAFAEKMLKIKGIPYIVDYDDAIFHNYDQSENPVVNTFLKNKIAKVMRYADLVTVGNSYLAEKAKASGSQKVIRIPTSLDIHRYCLKPKQQKVTTKFVIGWMGTSSTFQKHLKPCRAWLNKLLQENQHIFLSIVGVSQQEGWHAKTQFIPWTEDTEIGLLQKFDVGIMPLNDSPWERGKCAYKLIQYAAVGVPGIASDVGMNREVCIPGETGFIANTSEEWERYIITFFEQPQMRVKMGQAARNLVENSFSLETVSRQWIDLFENIKQKHLIAKR